MGLLHVVSQALGDGFQPSLWAVCWLPAGADDLYYSLAHLSIGIESVWTLSAL